MSLAKKFSNGMRAGLFGAVLLSGASFTYTAPAYAASPKYNLGMNFLWDKGNTNKLENSFQRMQEMGIKKARTDFEWRSVEKKQGQYDWSKIDNLVKLATQYNIELLPIVHYAPHWALPKGVSKPAGVYQVALSEEAYDDYSRFLNAAIDRYGPGGNAPFAFTPIKYWQVWNEPNLKEFWYMKSGFFGGWDMPKAAANFVKFMNTVDDNLGNRRQKIKIVHAGLSKSDITYMWHLWNNDPNYGDNFDIMAVHSYFFNPKGGVRGVDAIDKDDPEYSKLGFIGSKDDHGYLKKVFNVKHFLDLKKSPKPVWITEVGFMANNKGPVSGNPWVVEEGKAVELTQKTLSFINKNLDVDRVYWFVLDDYGFPNDTGNFGVYRSNGSARGGVKSALDSYTP